MPWNDAQSVTETLQFVCPKTWAQMDPTERDGIRRCDVCAKDVYETRSRLALWTRAVRGQCVSVPLASGDAPCPEEPSPAPQPSPADVLPERRLDGPPRRPLLPCAVVVALLAGGLAGLARLLGWL